MPELPPPLPPGERTVGQLVAEAIRLYGERFWRVLPLGAPLACVSQLALGRTATEWTGLLLAAVPFIALTYVVACALVLRARVTAPAYFAALLIFAPVPILVRIYVLPALAWLALFGLCAPAAMAERLRFREALRRGRQLGTADFVHALGSLCTLVIVVVLSEFVLVSLLRSQGETGERVAHLLGDLVLSPLLFVGSALLYLDQRDRVGRARRRSSNETPVP